MIIGEEILNLAPDSQYNIHFPLRRGEFNLHKGVSGSLTSVLEDFRTIWTYIIQSQLGIPASNLKVILSLYHLHSYA